MAIPWAEAGYTCLCIDLQHSPSRTRKQRYDKIEEYKTGGAIFYIYGDARSWKPSDFDKDFFTKYQISFVGAFPVCTNMAGSGSQYFQLKGLSMLCDGLLLFNACETIAAWSGAPYCIENPVGVLSHHHRKPDYYFHPWYYGDLHTKYTCLWAGNGFKMPEAQYLTAPDGTKQKIWLEPPGLERQNIRSETPQGFARAVFEANNK